MDRCGQAVHPAHHESESDPEVDVARGRDLASEAAFSAADRFVGALPIALLAPALLGPGTECAGWVGDVVLRTVARGVAHATLPGLALCGPDGSLAEGGLRPRGGVVQFALDKLVAERGVLPRGLDDCVFEAFAFGAGLGWVAKLALQAAAPGDDGVELVLVGLQGAGEVSALDRVGVLFASAAPVWLGQAGETPDELLALGGERERARVEVLNALQLARRQHSELRLQLLDAPE
jgi:hypothetical protein